ncbi:MAG: VOC family protein, partial [Gammaproteobacteria bacterium]
MIARFDHVVIAVPDIPAAVEAYKKLGFDVAEGGRHPSIGTRNAIIRFGLDYIELLAVEDKAKAISSGPFGAEFVDALERSSGLVAFVLASDNL